MTKAGITIKDDTLIIHESGNKENVLYRSQLQEYDFNGNKRKCIDISVLDFLKDNGFEITVH